MSHRVLIVDDQPRILFSFQRMLQGWDVVADTADCLEEAKRLLKENAYSAVITDLRLAGVLGEEGLDILRYVKDHHLETHVIFVTGYGSPAIMEKAFQMGAAFYFEKPVATDLLKDSLRSLGVGK